jgi:hypothetical protein
MISFDGVRLTYVGESGAFCLYTWQTCDEIYDTARAGCADLTEADRAVAACADYLARALELMEDCA